MLAYYTMAVFSSTGWRSVLVSVAQYCDCSQQEWPDTLSTPPGQQDGATRRLRIGVWTILHAQITFCLSVPVKLYLFLSPYLSTISILSLLSLHPSLISLSLLFTLTSPIFDLVPPLLALAPPLTAAAERTSGKFIGEYIWIFLSVRPLTKWKGDMCWYNMYNAVVMLDIALQCVRGEGIGCVLRAVPSPTTQWSTA